MNKRIFNTTTRHNQTLTSLKSSKEEVLKVMIKYLDNELQNLKYQRSKAR